MELRYFYSMTVIIIKCVHILIINKTQALVRLGFGGRNQKKAAMTLYKFKFLKKSSIEGV